LRVRCQKSAPQSAGQSPAPGLTEPGAQRQSSPNEPGTGAGRSG
jgi:hypothetical protein